MTKLIHAHNNERTDLGEFTPEKVANLVLDRAYAEAYPDDYLAEYLAETKAAIDRAVFSYPPPGSRFLLAGEPVRVVGSCPSDPSQVPVQTQSGRLLLVPVVQLEDEVKD